MSFKHIDHVELAWRLLGELPYTEAFSRLEAELVSLATAAGAPQKYDRRMTRAYFEIIAARRRPDENFAEFVTRNEDLLSRGRELVKVC